jgi:hypothetical protein
MSKITNHLSLLKLSLKNNLKHKLKLNLNLNPEFNSQQATLELKRTLQTDTSTSNIMWKIVFPTWHGMHI